MRIKELIMEYYFESALRKILDKNGKGEYYAKFAGIKDEINKKFRGNDRLKAGEVDFLTLAEYFVSNKVISDGEFYNLLIRDYIKYLILKSIRSDKNPIQNKEYSDIRKFRDYITFSEKVHEVWDLLKRSSDLLKRFDKYGLDKDDSGESGADNIGDKNGGNNVIEIFGKEIDKGDITYLDENIIVVRLDTPEKAYMYGKGLAEWCTARRDGGMFYSYRIEYKSSLFYMYMRRRGLEDIKSVYHIAVREDGKIIYADRSNTNIESTLDGLVRDIPESKPAVESGAFKTVPPTGLEMKVANLGVTLSIEEYNKLTYEERKVWLKSKSNISGLRVEHLDTMTDELKVIVGERMFGVNDNNEELIEYLMNDKAMLSGKAHYLKNALESKRFHRQFYRYELDIIKDILPTYNAKEIFDIIMNRPEIMGISYVIGYVINKLPVETIKYLMDEIPVEYYSWVKTIYNNLRRGVYDILKADVYLQLNGIKFENLTNTQQIILNSLSTEEKIKIINEHPNLLFYMKIYNQGISFNMTSNKRDFIYYTTTVSMMEVKEILRKFSDEILKMIIQNYKYEHYYPSATEVYKERHNIKESVSMIEYREFFLN